MRALFRFFGRALFWSKTVFFLLVLVAIASGTAYYFYKQNQKVLLLLNNPSVASDEEVKSLTAQVKKLMDLPDERPTIITVVDKERVKDQLFFARSENGDKVLVYTEAKKAIMYRPSTSKIIEVGPVEIRPNQTFKATLLNAASDSAALSNIQSILKDKVNNLELALSGDAKAKSYTKNLVIDVKGDKGVEAGQIAEIIGGEVSSLPSNETKPDADFLIIVAASK